MQLAFSVLPPVHIAPSSHALSLAVQAFSIDSCCRYVCQLASLPPVDKWHDRAVKTRLLPRSPSPPQVYTCLRHTITKGCNCTSEAPDTMDQSTQTRKPSHAAASSEGDSLLIQPGAQPFESCFPPAVVPAVTRQSSRKRTFTEKGAEMMKYLAPAKKQEIEQDKAVAGTLGTASGKKQLPSMKIPTRIGKYSALEVEPREQEEKKREPKKQSVHPRPDDRAIIEGVNGCGEASDNDEVSDSDEESDNEEHTPTKIRRMRAWSESDNGPMFPGLVALMGERSDGV